MSSLRNAMPQVPMSCPHPDSGVLPSAFCWSKFGIESGEAVGSIFARKERERSANAGVFLWGIGTSIRPSLEALLDMTASPEVVFSPMRSTAAPHDVRPGAVVAWRSATGLDGQPFEIPSGSLVTSRAPSSSRRTRHFALVCRSDTPLPDQGTHGDEWVDDAQIRNILTGRPVGSSQVTSVVQSSGAGANPRYRVAFRAQLCEPHLLILEDPEPVRLGKTMAPAPQGLMRSVNCKPCS